MKIIGTLDTKDDEDLLKDVLDHLPDMDAVFAYNDNSRDNTEEILKNHPKISKYVNRSNFPDEEIQKYAQHRRVHLLKMVKEEYSTYNTEDIWVVRLEGDRYFMNSTPWDMCHRGKFHGLSGIAGVMVDCRIGPNEDWTKLDTYPNWHLPITIIQNYGRIDDVHPVVAFRVEDGVEYSSKKPRPWPIVWGQTDYLENDRVVDEMAFFAHHGRRGPKYWCHAFGTDGTRRPSKKWPSHWDFSTPEKAHATVGFPFQPSWLHRLSSVRDICSLGYGHHPYGGEGLRKDIANLMAEWNGDPKRLPTV